VSKWADLFTELSGQGVVAVDSVDSQVRDTGKTDRRGRNQEHPSLLSEAAQNPPRALTARFPDTPARESTESIATTQAEDTDRSLADWRGLCEERSAIRQYDGQYSRAEAEALAWGEMQNRWHAEHGERVSRDLCAGCRRAIGSAQALDMIDGNRVHIGGGNDCLIRHGDRWRAAATRALMGLGLRPPVTEDGAR
jgi:hypothetical protein